MFNFKVFSLLVAILLGCAIANARGQSTSSVELKVFGASSIWWIAVLPENDDSLTSKVELMDASFDSYVTMAFNAGWGYYTYTSTSSTGFAVPLTFRLTSSSGSQITVQVSSIVPGEVINTGAEYGSSSASSTVAPSEGSDDTSYNKHKSSTSTSSASTTKTATTGSKTSTASATTGSKTSTASATTASATTGSKTSTTGSKTSTASATTASATTSTTGTKSSTSTMSSTSTSSSATSSSATSSSSTSLCGITSTSSEPLKLLVPLYVDPGSAWDELITAASSVQIIAIINPNSGPASPIPSGYSTYMAQMAAAGIQMIGYVYTTYGERAIADVEADIDTYASDYPGLSGIFFDEGATSDDEVSYYTTAYNYVLSKGYTQVILNPGAEPSSSYVSISTSIVIFEDVGANVAGTTFDSFVTCAPTAAEKSGYKYKFAGIANTAAAGDVATYLSDFANFGMGLVYVTDGASGCCTYNTLASYFTTEVSDIVALN